MRDSACRWHFVENTKIGYFKTFLKSLAGEKYRFLIGLCQQVFINLSIVYLD